MSRKDYVLVAEVLARYDTNTHSISQVVEALALAFASDNASFDRLRFLKACGKAYEPHDS